MDGCQEILAVYVSDQRKVATMPVTVCEAPASPRPASAAFGSMTDISSSCEPPNLERISNNSLTSRRSATLTLPITASAINTGGPGSASGDMHLQNSATHGIPIPRSAFLMPTASPRQRTSTDFGTGGGMLGSSMSQSGSFATSFACSPLQRTSFTSSASMRQRLSLDADWPSATGAGMAGAPSDINGMPWELSAMPSASPRVSNAGLNMSPAAAAAVAPPGPSAAAPPLPPPSPRIRPTSLLHNQIMGGMPLPPAAASAAAAAGLLKEGGVPGVPPLNRTVSEAGAPGSPAAALAGLPHSVSARYTVHGDFFRPSLDGSGAAAIPFKAPLQQQLGPADSSSDTVLNGSKP